jgi:hypothetical protein
MGRTNSVIGLQRELQTGPWHGSMLSLCWYWVSDVPQWGLLTHLRDGGHSVSLDNAEAGHF